MKFVVVLLAALGVATGAAAQTLPELPSEPLTFGDGRVVIGGDVAVSMAPPDNGFFNYGSYEQSTVRQFRLGVSGLVRLTDRISFLGELRSENLGAVAPFALFARVRPIPGRRLDIQIGRIPPTFGAFSRRAYSKDNPLIGYPLAYQYLTSLRADAVPANADELLRMRGRGWLSSYSIGNPEPEPGVPLISAFAWDTGVQVTGGWNIVTVSAAVTSGTASNPRVTDDNAGKQIAVRVAATPTTGLIVGSSFSRGEFLNQRVQALLPAADEDYEQRAYGADAEYSRDHWLVRAETVISEWHVPFANGQALATPLRAFSTLVEGRYAFSPGFYAAARLEHLAFSRITGSVTRDEWDAPVSRLEVGGGYYVQRNLILRASVQSNVRDGGRVRRARFLAGQVLYWF